MDEIHMKCETEMKMSRMSPRLYENKASNNNPKSSKRSIESSVENICNRMELLNTGDSQCIPFLRRVKSSSDALNASNIANFKNSSSMKTVFDLKKTSIAQTDPPVYNTKNASLDVKIQAMSESRIRYPSLEKNDVDMACDDDVNPDTQILPNNGLWNMKNYINCTRPTNTPTLNRRTGHLDLPKVLLENNFLGHHGQDRTKNEKREVKVCKMHGISTVSPTDKMSSPFSEVPYSDLTAYLEPKIYQKSNTCEVQMYPACNDDNLLHTFPRSCERKCCGKIAEVWKKDKRTWLWKSSTKID